MTIVMKNPEIKPNYDLPKGPLFVTGEYSRLFDKPFSNIPLRLSFDEIIAPPLRNYGIRLASLLDFDNPREFNMQWQGQGKATYLGIVVRGLPEEDHPEKFLAYKLRRYGIQPTQENPFFIPSYALKPALLGRFDIIPEEIKNIIHIPEFSTKSSKKDWKGATIHKSTEAECLVGLKGIILNNTLHTDWVIDDSPLEVMITKA